MAAWTVESIPPQNGRRSLITGATGGLGFETALALAGAGGTVVLTGRDSEKGGIALARIRSRHPSAILHYEHLDLASLRSITEFAARFADQYRALDVLILNAGVMAPARRTTTADGFELQFGTNYLGHFALAAQLQDVLQRGHSPRVVSLSSIVHRRASIDFDDLQGESNYRPWFAYGQSKLALLLFALELDRRSRAQGLGILSCASHPGYARTSLIANGPGRSSLVGRLGPLLAPLVSQSAAAGALPTLYAATAPTARGGTYYGPDGFYELTGNVREAFIAARARSTEWASRLWAISETLTHAPWPAARKP